jgi:hypothetical protein
MRTHIHACSHKDDPKIEKGMFHVDMHTHTHMTYMICTHTNAFIHICLWVFTCLYLLQTYILLFIHMHVSLHTYCVYAHVFSRLQGSVCTSCVSCNECLWGINCRGQYVTLGRRACTSVTQMDGHGVFALIHSQECDAFSAEGTRLHCSRQLVPPVWPSARAMHAKRA